MNTVQHVKYKLHINSGDNSATCLMFYISITYILLYVHGSVKTSKYGQQGQLFS